MTALETFARICFEAIQECGPGADVATIEKAVLKRVDALPFDERHAIDAGVKALTTYESPGFHEHGSH